MDADCLRATFLDRGVVRLDGAFPPDAADRIREVAWRYAARRTGVILGDRASWPGDGRLLLSWKGLKPHGAFDVLLDNAAVDAVRAGRTEME